MATHNQFAPSTTVTLICSVTLPTEVPLPAVDQANPAVLLQNVGPGVVYVFAGTSGGNSIANAPGAITLAEGEARLLPDMSGFGAGTVATVQSASGGGRLQFSRGTATPVWLFAAPAVTVI